MIKNKEVLIEVYLKHKEELNHINNMIKTNQGESKELHKQKKECEEIISDMLYVLNKLGIRKKQIIEKYKHL